MAGSACHKGGPTVACHVDTDSTNCSAVPLRDHSDQVIQVGIQRDGTCTIDKEVVACSNVGKQIRAAHAVENPRVTVCGDRNVGYEVVGVVLRALTNEDLPSMFGCSQEK
jgi:biopolymer transport protein ExbD